MRYLRATPELLQGYTGLIEVFDHAVGPARPGSDVVHAHGQDWPGYWRVAFAPQAIGSGFWGRLDTHVPAVQDHLRRYLHARGHDVRHLDDIGIGGRLTHEDAGACLARSVERTAAGLSIVTDILGLWRPVSDPKPVARTRRRLLDPKNQGGGLWCRDQPSPGMLFGWENTCRVDPATSLWTQGPETGEAGRHQADTSALQEGLALRCPEGGLLLPPPPTPHHPPIPTPLTP